MTLEEFKQYFLHLSNKQTRTMLECWEFSSKFDENSEHEEDFWMESFLDWADNNQPSCVCSPN